MITFLIPSIGRPSVQAAVDSLYKQTIPNWRAIVCFDRVQPNIQPSEKVSVMVCDDQDPVKFRAGLVRNYARKHVKTEWVGLLDDDDSVTPDYVDKLKQCGPNSDIVVFQMIYQGGRVLPPNRHTEFLRKGRVGISFAFRNSINVAFKPIFCEDYYFLSEARQKGCRITLCPHVCYRVKH